jgi:hypothetical protein
MICLRSDLFGTTEFLLQCLMLAVPLEAQLVEQGELVVARWGQPHLPWDLRVVVEDQAPLDLQLAAKGFLLLQ